MDGVNHGRHGRESVGLVLLGCVATVVLLAVHLALPGKADAYVEQGYVPSVATNSANVGETARVLESQGGYDVSTPNYKNPGGNDDPNEDTIKDPTPYTTTVRPSGATDAPDPYLRWGSATWQGNYVDNWDGWGWRHIQAKHGWSAADESATREALVAPAITNEDSPTAMRYEGPTYTQAGALCDRVVVVEFSEATGPPKGIITSYGNYLGPAP